MVDCLNPVRRDLSIYLHWPFCLSKCPYCDFMSVPTCRSDTLFERYGSLLFKDLKRSLIGIDHDFSIKTIFFGGGTPSLMRTEDVEAIIDFLKKISRDSISEISLEANPATFDEEKMHALKAAGINRISLGIQSFSNDSLHFLGRIYNANQALRSAEIVTKIFDNVSFDFIYGYEGQSIKALEEDLEKAASFDCKHVSCYQLTFEEKTPFYKKLQEGSIRRIGEEVEADFYKFVTDFLAQRGFQRYEISNYAKKGFECQHNLVYWNYGDYLGVGPAAHGRMSFKNSYLNSKKRRVATEKIYDPWKWAEAVDTEAETYSTFYDLTQEEILEEILIMTLRLTQKSLKKVELYEWVPSSLMDRIFSKNKINFLRKQNLIRGNSSNSISLTESGILHLNSVVEFLVGN